MNRRAFVLAFAAACATAACKRSSDQNESKRMPKPPPPPSAEASPELQIAVEIDGHAGATIDRTALNAAKPDFSDSERRAWRIETLIGAPAKRAGTVIAVTGEKGVTVTLRQTDGEKDPLAVLVVSRRGDVIAAMVEPDDPFPPYHGQGGRLGRRGDPLPRIAGVTKIAVSVAPTATD